MSSDQETTMLWKVEPLSPSGTPPLDIDEEWLNFDEKPAVLEGAGEQSGLYEEHLTRAQVATKFLEELELKNWIKEESFADWLEEKIDLPIFEELPAPECGQNRAVIYQNNNNNNNNNNNATIVKLQQQPIGVTTHQPVDTTQSLLREFETVLGDVEACHQIHHSTPAVVSTLTPPQSPPPLSKQHLLAQQPNVANAHLLVSLQPLHQPVIVYEQQRQQHHEESTALTSLHNQHHLPETYSVSSLALNGQIGHQIADQWTAENLSLVPLVHGSDVAHELAKVDEYVRSCAEDVAAASSSSNLSSASSSPPSPCTSSNGSYISSEDSIDDPDWSFETSNIENSSGSGTSHRRPSQARAGRRAKPYSRPSLEDKRVRKKEQNKNAATRYRQKKKQEIKKILGEEQELAGKNDKLQAQVKDLQREIGYLKGLMRDLFKAKGLIK